VGPFAGTVAGALSKRAGVLEVGLVLTGTRVPAPPDADGLPRPARHQEASCLA
jgi:hypothetical protein